MDRQLWDEGKAQRRREINSSQRKKVTSRKTDKRGKKLHSEDDHKDSCLSSVSSAVNFPTYTFLHPTAYKCAPTNFSFLPASVSSSSVCDRCSFLSLHKLIDFHNLNDWLAKNCWPAPLDGQQQVAQHCHKLCPPPPLFGEWFVSSQPRLSCTSVFGRSFLSLLAELSSTPQHRRKLPHTLLSSISPSSVLPSQPHISCSQPFSLVPLTPTPPTSLVLKEDLEVT